MSWAGRMGVCLCVHLPRVAAGSDCARQSLVPHGSCVLWLSSSTGMLQAGSAPLTVEASPGCQLQP